jgi:hypothetical protein
MKLEKSSCEFSQRPFHSKSFFQQKIILTFQLTGSMEENAARYLHLLEPIRDVSVNWDSNIQEYLKEYLDKLEQDRERAAIGEGGQTIK